MAVDEFARGWRVEVGCALRGGKSLVADLVWDFGVLGNVVLAILEEDDTDLFGLLLLLDSLEGALELVLGSVSNEEWVEDLVDCVVNSDDLHVAHVLDNILHICSLLDGLEEGSVAIGCELDGEWRLHHDFSVEADSWEHVLLEEDEVFFHGTKVIVFLEVSNCRVVVLIRGHHEHLAFLQSILNIWLVEIIA